MKDIRFCYGFPVLRRDSRNTDLTGYLFCGGFSLRQMFYRLIVSLMAILWLTMASGCSSQQPEPTTSHLWYLDIQDQTVDGPTLIAELSQYWADFGVSFEFGAGEPRVSIQTGNPDDTSIGHCGVGTSCVAYVAPLLERYNPDNLERHLAVVVSHEMGHSYGLSHTTGDGCSIMNAEYFGICTVHTWDDADRESLLSLLGW
ncbi:MAG: hypothetical protein L0Y56_10270 [Nitrospira sp.]|nr:hypothetical protein [Nitrospira sp.]